MAKNKGGKMMFIKLIARMTECYFYLCLILGFLASMFICIWGVLKSWNLFVKSKGEFLEWLKVWKCKEYITEKYRFALMSETTFKTALEYIENEEIRKNLLKTWEGLKHAE